MGTKKGIDKFIVFTVAFTFRIINPNYVSFNNSFI